MKLFALILATLPIHAMGSATYTVPASATSPAETFALSNISLSKDANNRNVIRFQLPDDLVGLNYQVTSLNEAGAASATEQSYFGNGVQATNCTENSTQIQCTLKYQDSNLPAVSTVSDYLKVKYASADPSTLNTKLNVSENFLRDPEGILLILK